MPITIPDTLPARISLIREGVMVMKHKDAIRQDIRPMQILLLNLMPHKEVTETQLARLLGSTPLQVEMTLLTTESYTPRNVVKGHLQKFYRSLRDIRHRKFDGLLITGAPVEVLSFEQVAYWEELCELLEWSQHNVMSSFAICWGAQASLYYFRGVEKEPLDHKCFGIYKHRVVKAGSTLLRGFDDEFKVPVSRYTQVMEQALPDDPELRVLARSDEAGLCLVEDRRYRFTYMFNHLEYDAETLLTEYRRDLEAGKNTSAPANYFPGDDPSHQPVNSWRAHAHLLIANWLNDLYQATPFRLEDIPGQ